MNEVFREILDQSFWWRIVFSLLCGFVIGIERQVRGKPVDIRTSILICMGTMLFVYLGEAVQEGKEIARVLGQVVTGIGFIGAGVIMTKEGLVIGVTSASVVWILAGLGAAIALQHYAVAIVICFLTVTVLVGMESLEEVFKSLRQSSHSSPNKDE